LAKVGNWGFGNLESEEKQQREKILKTRVGRRGTTPNAVTLNSTGQCELTYGSLFNISC